MALYDIIMHQNKDDTGTAYSEVYPNLASGDPNIYNVLVAGEDGIPVLPQGVLREVNSETLILEIGQYDEIHINDTVGGYIHFLSPNVVIQNTGANIIELSTAGAFTQGNEITMLSDYIDMHKTNANGIKIYDYGILLECYDPGERIELFSYNRDYRINAGCPPPNISTNPQPTAELLYWDGQDSGKLKKMGIGNAIPDFVAGQPIIYPSAAMDTWLRGIVQNLIKDHNIILAELRNHGIIFR